MKKMISLIMVLMFLLFLIVSCGSDEGVGGTGEAVKKMAPVEVGSGTN